MRARVLALAATAAVVAAVMPAHAGATKAQITDATGDANGVNSQPGLLGTGGPNPNAATAPASYSGDDILSVSFVTNFVTKKVKRKTVKTPVSFTATMRLAAPPDAQSYYVVDATSSDCPDGISFEYSTESQFEADGVSCFDASSGSIGSINDYPAMPAVVKGNTISWTVPVSGIKVGTVLSGLEAYAGVGPFSTGTLDEADSTATYTVGK
jgi:hypothetical protein